MNNNTEITTENDGIEICEDCKVWSCDCFCDEIAEYQREIYLMLRGK
jgi:hypothetical protein